MVYGVGRPPRPSTSTSKHTHPAPPTPAPSHTIALSAGTPTRCTSPRRSSSWTSSSRCVLRLFGRCAGWSRGIGWRAGRDADRRLRPIACCFDYNNSHHPQPTQKQIQQWLTLPQTHPNQHKTQPQKHTVEPAVGGLPRERAAAPRRHGAAPLHPPALRGHVRLLLPGVFNLLGLWGDWFFLGCVCILGCVG